MPSPEVGLVGGSAILRRMRAKHLSLVMLVWLATSIVACGDSATAVGVVDAGPSEAATVLENEPATVVLDIRTPEEVAEGTLPGAVNIDFYDPGFRDAIAELDREATYLVYCRSGNRSSQAGPMFEDLGFTDVSLLEGGILAWSEEGLPLQG